MKWSVRIGRFADVDVYMHYTFLLLVGWFAFINWRQGQSISAAVAGVALILAIFLCVVLHEYGHALMARRYGIKTRDIILLPIGGVARLERLPDKPMQELWVALAGPAVNVAVVILVFAWLQITAGLKPLQNLYEATGPFLGQLLAINIFMVVFNMIPAFPMDGGRVLRALLATRKNYARATRIAASIGQATAVLFGVVGIFYNPILLVIAVFVWIGAAQEAGMTQMKSAIEGIPVREAMVSDFRVLYLNDRLSDAVDLTLATHQKDFPVIANGNLEGILTQSALFNALAGDADQASVKTAINKDVVTVSYKENLDTALAKLRECNCHTLPVVLKGKLVGLVTMDNMGEYMRFRSAMSH
jgi:Zn-dependent protease